MDFINVYFYRLREDLDYEQYFHLLSPQRQEKTARLKRPEDRQLSIMAEMLLRYGLKALGIEKPEFAIAQGGKPYIINADVHFNLSHSGSCILCAVSSHPVGVDIQRHGAVPEGVVSRYFSPGERERLKSCTDRTECFYELWALKESCMKATGEGLRLSPARLDFSFDCGISVKKDGMIVKDQQFVSFSPQKDYAAALCQSASLPLWNPRELVVPQGFI